MPPGEAPSTTRRADAARARLLPSSGARDPRLARVVSAAPFALPAAALAWLSIRAILAKLGHPGAALDDSFIHFQYARALAEGHPFRYEPGEPMTMGATSALWPLLLAPFYAIGFKGLAILWPAWGLSFVALGLLAREVMKLAEPLAGRSAGAAAAAMVFAFSPFTWCAGSGMEVVPFALCVARAARRASEWSEGRDGPTGPSATELVLLAIAAPLFRPEGALASLVIAAAFLNRAHAGSGSLAARLRLSALALAGAVTPEILSVVVTGSLRSNTAQVKLLPGNPYYPDPTLLAAIRHNVDTLVHTLLNGEIWSAEFIPHGAAPFAFAGLACVVWLGAGSRSLWFRAATVVLLAAAIAVPCAYVSFLWNRLRYLWPFAPFWIVGLACLARVIGDALGVARPRWRTATLLVGGLFVGLFGAKLEGTIDDLADSASGIDRQQVKLGMWAHDALESGARIGVNDTGAIAYFGDHPTFDIVGLTTQGEGRYWVGGAASRFEHYEHLAASEPGRLPRYFVVYPEWMALGSVLGRRLHEATVTDSTILGGQTMIAYEADYSLLGSGERPWSDPSATVVDALDVADLESEASHEYELLGGDDGDEIVTTVEPHGEGGGRVADGGRRNRSRDSFLLDLSSMTGLEVIVRLAASEATRVDVTVNREPAASFTVEPPSVVEARFPLPSDDHRMRIECAPRDGTLTTYHYWFVRTKRPPQ